MKKGFGKTEDADIRLKELHIVRNLGGVRPIPSPIFLNKSEIWIKLSNKCSVECTGFTTKRNHCALRKYQFLLTC